MMAFHVACPITCERICYCPLGFGKKIVKKCFLDDVFKLEQFFNDPWSVKVNKDSQTVQVLVPKVVVPPPAPIPIHISNANNAVDVVVVNKEVVESVGGGGGGDGVGEREEKEMLSLQAKRIALQKQAFEASLAAEEYVRKIESGVLMDDSGEALPDNFREDQGVKVMCRICFDGENEGSEKASRMLACKLCNKKYHRSCLKSWGLHRDLFHLSSWVCSSCRTCEVCRRTGNPTKFMFCKRCDGAHHCYCLQHAQKNVSIGPYLCPKHTKCHSCASNVSGNGPSTKWFLGYTFCDACGRLFVKGNYCPVCLKVYRDTEPTPMVCCDVCQRWVHCQCDGISDDKYLQFQADGNLYYKCAACRGECYKVTGPEDAVQEVWRRRDKADHGLIASLRDAAGLPSEEAFSVSIYSDDEDYIPTISKNDPGGSLKFSVKGSGLKGTKSTKQYGKKSSKKIYGKKKGYQVSLIGGEDAHHSFDGHDQRSIEFNLSDEKHDDMTLYRSEGMDMLSSPTARSPGNTREKCSINQAGFMKHDFVEEVPANNGKRVPKVAQTKSGKSHGSGGFGYEKQENTKGKKLVIHIGARNKNVINSPRSEASSCHREQDITASNGSEDTSHIKVKKKYGVERNDGAARMYDGEDGKSESKETLKYSRVREGSLLKLGKVKPEVSELNSQSKEGKVAAPESVKGAPTLRTEEVPLRRHSKGRSEMHSETQNTNMQASGLDSLPKDPKPLLKLKFKNSNPDKDRKSPVPQEEEKSSVKGQRSKRKRPSEKNEVREEENNTQLHQDNPVTEVMDANWVLKKLGKDAIGKRVEVHHPSDGSWHKGVVTDVIEGTSTLSVRLDEGGRDRKLELGKQAIRFISQKQKRTKAIML